MYVQPRSRDVNVSVQAFRLKLQQVLKEAESLKPGNSTKPATDAARPASVGVMTSPSAAPQSRHGTHVSCVGCSVGCAIKVIGLCVILLA